MTELTPNDLVNQAFHVTLRGYARDEVDDFLQQASDSLFEALEDAQRLRAQVTELKARIDQYQQTESVIKSTLVTAERAAEEVRATAHREADLIRREAEERLREERAALEELRQLRLRVIAETRAILYAHLAMLESQEKQFSPSQDTHPGEHGL